MKTTIIQEQQSIYLLLAVFFPILSIAQCSVGSSWTQQPSKSKFNILIGYIQSDSRVYTRTIMKTTIIQYPCIEIQCSSGKRWRPSTTSDVVVVVYECIEKISRDDFSLNSCPPSWRLCVPGGGFIGLEVQEYVDSITKTNQNWIIVTSNQRKLLTFAITASIHEIWAQRKPSTYFVSQTTKRSDGKPIHHCHSKQRSGAYVRLS